MQQIDDVGGKIRKTELKMNIMNGKIKSIKVNTETK